MPDEYDIEQAWEEVLKSFEKTSRVKLHPDKLLSPQEVIDQLNAHQEQKDEAKKKHRRLRKALNRTLEAVKIFGTIAAMDQSNVLGPSNLVYAAIVILIQAGTAYSMIYERLEELFRAIADILERFDVYRTMRSDLDLPMRKIIHGFLQSIITICALSLKVLNSNKLTKYLKVLAFSEDDGVRKQLDILQKGVEREAMMLSTLSYRNIKEGFDSTNDGLHGVKKAVDDLTEDITRRETENTDRRQIEMIKAKLGVRADRQETQRAHLHGEVIEGTGSWLLNDDIYERWTDHTQEATEIILLSAEQGHGKTFLSTRVISDLLKRKSQSPTSSTSRRAVGFYYLQAHDSTGVHDDEIFSVDTILKTIAVQFCHDLVYRKQLAGLCENWTEPDSLDELCTKLLHPCFLSVGDTFFIVIDGIDRANEKQLNGLVSLLGSITMRFTLSQRSRVRILLSGRPKTMGGLARSLTNINTDHSVIDVGSRNSADVALFVQDQLDNMSLLAGDSAQIKQLRQEVFDCLTSLGGNDFVNLALLLQEIAGKVWPAEVRAVLLSAKDGGQRSDTIAREVARCNTALSSQEIKDLNVLLLWVMCSRRTLRVSELDAVLFLANGESPLKSLRDQLEKYSVFFHVYAAPDAGPETGRGWMVSLSSDSIRQYFGELSHQETLSELSSNKVQETEVKIVRRFLASVCEDELYSKFGFEEFFTRKLNSTTTFVHVDVESAACTLLIGCLQAITSAAEETKELLDYAANFFARHMNEVDLSMTSPVRKFEVGRYLLPVLTDSKAITRWLEPLSKDSIAQLFFADDVADLLVTYVHDTAISKGFTLERKQWTRSLSSTDVLGDIAKVVSQRLFGMQPSQWGLKLRFSCVHAYKSKLEQQKGSTMRRPAELKNFEVSAAVVVKVFTWVAEIHGMDIAKDYEWNRSLARMLRLYDNLDAAIAQYQVACTLAEDPWFAKYGLGSALHDRKEFAAAIEIFKSVEANIEDGTAKSNDPRTYLRPVRSYRAYCHKQLGQLDEALAVYDKHLRESEAMDYDFVWCRLDIYYRRNEVGRIVDCLQDMQPSIDPYFGIRRTSRLLHWMSDTADLSDMLTKIRRETGNSAFVHQLLDEAISDTYKPEYLIQWPLIKAEYRALLRLLLSEEKWRAATTEKAKDETIDYWEDLIRDTMDVGIDSVYVKVARRLAEAYTERLRRHEPEAPEVQALSKRITELATRDTSQQDAWFSTLNTTLLLARWFSTLGRIEQAQKLARGSVKIALELLSDEDPENDWEAFIRLATVLMYCGEDDNALAAWSLLLPKQVFETPAIAGPVRVNSAGVDGAQPDTVPEQRLDGDLDYLCDGDCGTEWAFGDDIHVCKDCLDVMFCTPCIGRLRRDEIGENICNPQHEHLHVPKFEMSETRARGKTNVRLRGKVVPISDWLNQIRKDWQLEANVPDTATNGLEGRRVTDDWEERSRDKLLSRQTTKTLES